MRLERGVIIEKEGHPPEKEKKEEKKENKFKGFSNIKKFLSGKVVSKDIIKSSPQSTYDISATEVPSHYINRFFKSSYIAEGRLKNE